MKSCLKVVFSLMFMSLVSTAQAEVRGVFHTADEVFATVSPTIEEEFDAFIIANTLESGSANDLIPFQHVRYVVKKSPELKVFRRDDQGRIIGFLENNITTLQGLPQFLPISSGVSGSGSIRSFSGVFRINHRRSRDRLNTSREAPMSYAMYLDAIYPSGRESGAAMHGTPTKNHRLLGNSRASHGCLRTFPDYAKLIYSHLIQNDSMYSDDLIEINRRTNLPGPDAQNGLLGTRRGTRALFIIFNGYSQSTKTK
jgi:lipoprotein-anchoring transpeptidase ErfK/SrfK